MITHVFSDCVLVVEFKESQAGNLVKVLVLLLINHFKFFFANSVRTHQLNKVLVVHCFEWASMVFILAWLHQPNRLCASPRFIILSLSLTSVAVSNVVRVVLFELVSIDVLLLNEFLLPKSK